jgi:hypothetical protein
MKRSYVLQTGWIVFALLVFLPILGLAQTAKSDFSERAPFAQQTREPVASNHVQGQKALFDVLLQFDQAQQNGEYGVVTDGQYIYTARWNSNEFYRYDLSGNYVSSFTIPGVSELRDLTFDGQYAYGVNNGTAIFQMDLALASLVGTITTGLTSLRGIAYDSVNDGFWLSSGWSPANFIMVNRSGTSTLSVSNASSLLDVAGIAWENVSDGNPYLWLLRQDSGGTQALLQQVDLATGLATGVSYNISTGLGLTEPSGGLDITNLVDPTKWAFLGSSQNEAVWAIELDDADPLPPVAVPLTSWSLLVFVVLAGGLLFFRLR